MAIEASDVQLMRRSRALFALLLVALPLPALAQQRDSSATGALKQLSIEQLTNLEVTSVSKRPELLSQAPSAIQVITGEDIRRSGATSIPEALRLASNLQVAQVDARQWAISARGFNSTTANKLLVLIDGRTIYTPLYSGVFWDVQDVLLEDVDRIEVVSGPGATLWGANAVNGVVNIITKNARDTQGPYAVAGGGNAQSGFGGARWGGTSNRLSYRVYGKGFGRAATDLPSGTGAQDDWHFGQGGFRADWTRSDATRFTLQGDGYGGAGTQPTAADMALAGGNIVGSWSHDFSARSNARLELYYDRTHRSIPGPGTFNEDLDTYDADFQHRYALGRHNLVWGLGYRFESDRVDNIATLAFLPARVHRDWFTGFVQDEIALVPELLHVVVGTKLEHNDYTGFEVQPSCRLSWTPKGGGSLWTAVSRAVRTPSRLDRELFVPAQPPFVLAGGPNFQSENLIAYELGYRTLLRDKVGVSLATFYNHYTDLRSTEMVNPPAPFPIVIANGQHGHSYGAELTLDVQASERWRLRGGYTELRVRIDPNPGSTDASHGRAETADPDRQILLGSELDLPRHLSLDLNGRYVGKIENQQLPAYAELDARLGWRPLPALEVSVVGQNLLHDHHVEFGTATARREIERGVYGRVEWHF